MKKTNCPTCKKWTDSLVVNVVGAISCPDCVGIVEEEVLRLQKVFPGLVGNEEFDMVEKVFVSRAAIVATICVYQHWQFRTTRWLRDPPKDFDHRITFHGRYSAAADRDRVAVGDGRCFESAWRDLQKNLRERFDGHRRMLHISEIGSHNWTDAASKAWENQNGTTEDPE